MLFVYFLIKECFHFYGWMKWLWYCLNWPIQDDRLKTRPRQAKLGQKLSRSGLILDALMLRKLFAKHQTHILSVKFNIFHFPVTLSNVFQRKIYPRSFFETTNKTIISTLHIFSTSIIHTTHLYRHIRWK